ncbi:MULTISPECIES: NAD-dependent epimerase/dehydratase family protein [unclassified Vibrio]|uniref:NAD-dependent epimerase/dehydratase family protein n=1 Tax=Vibrio sp. HB236076 TaxID=3232307 RepID=A0AB39HBU7_9VIBR|nr:NAD-dependent epimerase/dehydratase family protein [Vibrio sp. HB161653]MDP5253628.1 NAD-dependent epimerase/dehydratase family protein [Vibrio sp. HB161653]
MSKLLIIGGGWLGSPLANQLVRSNQFKNSQVHVVRRSVREETLPPSVILHHLDLNQDSGRQSLAELMTTHGFDLVIGCFPPGFRHGKGEHYLSHWQCIAELCHQTQVKQVIQISSTSVYPDQSAIMKEEDASLALAKNNPLFGDKAIAMLDAEATLSHRGFKSTILRCSGLIGPSRHPARFAARLKSVSTQASANMVHQSDVIRAIEFCLTHQCEGIYNLSCPTSVSKAEFYRVAIETAKLSAPLPPQSPSPGKTINGDLITKQGFQYQYPHSLDAIKAIEFTSSE